MPSPSDSKLPGLPGFDPHNLQPWLIEVSVGVSLLATVAVALRLGSRYLTAQRLWWDDWMILFSLFWYFLGIAFIFIMYEHGLGLHADIVPEENIPTLAKWLLVAESFYSFNIAFTKFSLLFMYYRIFHIPLFKTMAWIVGGIVLALAIAMTCLFIFACVPVEKLWNSELSGHCSPESTSSIANAASTMFTDLIILLMPLPQIWKLQLKMREKIGVTAAFCLGFFVVFASAYRAKVLFTLDLTDPTYTLAPTVGWTTIETSAGITSACLPTLLPIVNWIGLLFGIKVPKTTKASSYDLHSGNKSSTRSRAGTKRDSNRATDDFYRMSDEEELTGPISPAVSVPSEAKLRPEGKASVQSQVTADKSRESGDDILLRGIVVQREFERSESTKEVGIAQ